MSYVLPTTLKLRSEQYANLQKWRYLRYHLLYVFHSKWCLYNVDIGYIYRVK